MRLCSPFSHLLLHGHSRWRYFPFSFFWDPLSLPAAVPHSGPRKAWALERFPTSISRLPAGMWVPGGPELQGVTLPPGAAGVRAWRGCSSPSGRGKLSILQVFCALVPRRFGGAACLPVLVPQTPGHTVTFYCFPLSQSLAYTSSMPFQDLL